MLASLQKIFDVENYTFWIEGILDRIWDIYTQERILISSFVKVSNFETPKLELLWDGACLATFTISQEILKELGSNPIKNLTLSGNVIR